MRSLADWKKSGMSFSKFCAVGEEVNEEIIDYFINIVPLAYLKNRLAQCGESCNHIFDERKGRMRAA